MKTKAFTMIELVFVIVVLGILSAIAIPRFAATRDDAMMVRGKSQVSAIRSGIALQKSRRLLEGNTSALPNIDSVTNYNASDERLFNFSDGNTSNVLEYPILSRISTDGSWVKTNVNAYAFRVLGVDNNFTYNNVTGLFNCTTGIASCDDLTR